MPSFRSSSNVAAISETNFEKIKGTSNHMILVPLIDLKSLRRVCGRWCRDFKTAALTPALTSRQVLSPSGGNCSTQLPSFLAQTAPHSKENRIATLGLAKF